MMRFQRNIALGIWFACCVALQAAAQRVEIREDFASDPAARGWNSAGVTNLFRWSPVEKVLKVTWDSSQSNSFFFRRLGTVVSKTDDFDLQVDLRLDSVRLGITPGRPFTFELALGLVNTRDFAATNFHRGSGISAATGPRNLVEFDYFPDSGFGATVSPTIVSSSNQFATSFTFPLELAAGVTYHLGMHYAATNQLLQTTLRPDGGELIPVKDVVIAGSFGDFRADAFAICSYSDAEADGSVRAEGVISRVVLQMPDGPIQNLVLARNIGGWEARFNARGGWTYGLQRSGDLKTWSDLALRLTAQIDTPAILKDTNSIAGTIFYRVSAERP